MSVFEWNFVIFSLDKMTIKYQKWNQYNTIIQGHHITFSVLFFTYLKNMESSKHMDNI